MDELAKHVAYIVGKCQSSNINVVEASEAAEDAWVEEIIEAARDSAAFQAACTPGYYNNEGQPSPKTAATAKDQKPSSNASLAGAKMAVCPA